MPTDRAGAGGRGKDDLQHDGGGAGHASQKSKKDLDRELDDARPTETEPAGDPKVKP